MAEEKFKNFQFIAIFCILRQYFDLLAAITSSSIMAVGYFRVCSCFICKRNNTIYISVYTYHLLKCYLRYLFFFKGDKELAQFLNDEIQLEKKNEKTPDNLRDFDMKMNGPEVILTKKLENEV